jgi:N-acetylmuramate 1-kinase
MHLNDKMLKFVRQALGLGDSDELTSMTLAKRGSGRSFHRVRYEGRGSVVFMCYDKIRKENGYYAAIADFLLLIHVQVPRIISHDPLRGFIVMEDLGERDLRSYSDESQTQRNAYYRATLSLAHRLHAFAVEDFPLDKVPLVEGFSPDLYRWERDYFLENFVQGVCGIELNPSDAKDLEEELQGLAARLHDVKQTLVHRDLQSQNVMICKGRPAFIDFQGMRFGNPFYDLGSLLYDPYVSLTENERMELLLYYYQLPARGGDTPQYDTSSGTKAIKVSRLKTNILRTGWAGFQDKFRDASSQRLMQALGAYGFLGLKSGLPEFLTHIPRGIANLADSASRARRLPLLKNLAISCQRSLGRKS